MGAKDLADASAVHVIVRVRPQNSKEAASGGKLAVKWTDTEISVDSSAAATGESFARFTFDKIFPPDSQQAQVFNQIGLPLVETVFEGYNGTIFAYGQTSSGKTYTMQGPEITDPNLAGIIPRTAEAIFQTIAHASEDMEFTVRASYVEIYLERIRDLLDPARQNLQVREDPNKGVYVEGMSEQYVNSFDEMMDLMTLGSRNRAQAATGMNEGSSRSHSVFVLQLVQKDTKSGQIKTSKINLVDLAGSEMVRKTGATGERLDEAKMINLSLSALGKVINALTDGKSSHIPYRDSKLTRMLQESLGGNARTWLVINVSPSSYNASETLSTLRFGNRAKAIQNKAVVNQVRTVEELEALLAQAERAIDVQAQHIEKLKLRLTARGATRTQAPSASDTGSASALGEDEVTAEDAVEQAAITQRVVELETRVRELEEIHESDVREQERSSTELGILTEELQQEKESKESTIAAKLAQIAGLNERLALAQQEATAAQNKLDEAIHKFEHLEHEHKELSLTVGTLQMENAKLHKELDAMPASAVAREPLDHIGAIPPASQEQPDAAVASENPPSGTQGESSLAVDNGDQSQDLKTAQATIDELRSKLASMRATYEATIQDLKAKLPERSAEGPNTDKTGVAKSSMNPELEQRLYQLIAVHRQLLRKYAHAELAAAEKASKLSLKDERIRILETNLKTKEYNFRAQSERHALELEEVQLEHQRELQELQLDLSKARRELQESKSSFGSRALSLFPGRKSRSPQGNRIVKPLRGGSLSAASGTFFSSAPQDTAGAAPTERERGGQDITKQPAELGSS